MRDSLIARVEIRFYRFAANRILKIVPQGGMDNESIPNVNFKSILMEGQTRCSVCLEYFTEGETVKRIEECTHMFHVQCIGTWLQNKCTCPMCRRKLCEHTHAGGINRDNIWQLIEERL